MHNVINNGGIIHSTTMNSANVPSSEIRDRATAHSDKSGRLSSKNEAISKINRSYQMKQEMQSTTESVMKDFNATNDKI